jgi:hypothetical protein
MIYEEEEDNIEINDEEKEAVEENSKEDTNDEIAQKEVNEEEDEKERGDEEENDDGNEKEEGSEEEESLPFAKAEVVRLMKQNLDSDKMIRERVKVEMNRFLGDVLKNVCNQLNEYPYTTIEYEMLKESTYPYTNITRINQEKERILLHLEAIKADCNALSMDVKKTLKIKDVIEEDEDFKEL